MSSLTVARQRGICTRFPEFRHADETRVNHEFCKDPLKIRLENLLAAAWEVKPGCQDALGLRFRGS